MLYPPRPSNISIPAVITGNSLQNDDTSISLIDSGFDGTVVIRTQNNLAMVIDKDQRTSINTATTNAMLTINNDSSTLPTLRLSYQDRFHFDGRIESNGNIVFTPNSDNASLNPNLTTIFTKNFDINDHDGMHRGLRLGGILVSATASEINYVDVPAGVALPQKAIVLDSSSSVSGLNRLDAQQLSGTLLTGPQPNITSLRTVNITENLLLRGQPFALTQTSMGYIQIDNEGIAYPSKAMILNFDRSITGINSLSATTITGTLTAGAQPNITSLSGLQLLVNNGPTTLNAQTTIRAANGAQLVLRHSDTISSSLGTNELGHLNLSSTGRRVVVNDAHNFQIIGHNGSTTGLVLGSTLITATADQINFTNVAQGIGTASRAMVLDTSRNINGINRLTATSLVGVLETASQPLIRSVNTLNIANHNGSNGLALGGVLITASATQMNAIDVVAGSAVANKALVLDSSANISGINALNANALSGIIMTPNQPNINQVRSLSITDHNRVTGLMLGGTLVTASAAQINRLDSDVGVAAAGKVLVVDSSINISGINSLSSNLINGIIQTTSQPNISEVNVLNVANHNGTSTGLRLNGQLITSTANHLNRVNVIAGVGAADRALVLDNEFSISGINSLRSNTLGGILTTANQPNIRTLASINITDHNGTSTGLSLNGILVLSTATQINTLQVSAGVASASRALVVDASRSINNINVLSATTINGILGTASQPFINRVSTLNIMNHDGTSGLSLNGVLVTASANQINALNVSEGIAVRNRALILNSERDIVNINNLTASTLGGVLTTAAQPNLNMVNILNIANHDGSTGLSLNGVLVTASAESINRIDTTVGFAVSGKALIADALLNISNINALSAISLSGIIQTAHQPNIASVNALNIALHNGSSNGLRLNGRLVLATADQLNFNSVAAGTAIPNRSLVTDAFNSIAGINTLRATNLTAERLSLSGVISNFNVGNVIIKSYSFTDLIGRMMDIQLINRLSFSRFSPAEVTSGYSSEIIGYIRPQYSENYTFFITCNDRVRLWINGEMILHSWVPSATPRGSSTIFLNAEQWVSIYIQYQVDRDSIPNLLVEWVSNSTMRAGIPSERLAWDNNPPAVSYKQFSQNAFTIYNTVTTNASTARFSVDSSGDLTIDSSGNNIILGPTDNLNIPSHDGSRGLYLGGVLVTPTAFELNYLKVNPGITSPSSALVVNASRSITGLNSITATSVSCTNLSASAFTISDLRLDGPISNFNVGALMIRQFTGPDISGRIVDVSTIADINLNNYDPRELNTFFSLDISGFILPTLTDTYRFHVIVNDRCRIWVNNQLILNVWDVSSGVEHTSDPISLTANHWTRIYIQFQNLTGSSSLQVRWSSSAQPRAFINSAFMAWDNSITSPPRHISSSDQLTIFSSSAGLTSAQTGTISVDQFGNMSLSTRSGFISIAAGNNFNIAEHNGTTGLRLAGTLVTATSAELNYLSGVVPGSVVSSKALVLDSNKSLSGITTISCDNFFGVCQTPNQPNITSFGRLTSTLNSQSDIVITNTNSLRFWCDSTACFIQAGSSLSNNAAADLFIGNYNSSVENSTRKLMIKANGFVGIQTSSPARALSVNGSGELYSLRLINNSANGSETVFCDLGVDTSSNFRIGSNMIIGSSGTATLSVNNGHLRIATSGGSVQIGNTNNNTLPLELGSTPFNLSTTAGFLNSEGSVGATIPTAINYSLRTSASIIVTGTVCVTSDRRLKKDIQKLNYDTCKQFIVNSNPIKFKYRTDNTDTTHFGLIAQDVLKSEFSDLVNAAPHHGLKSDVDIDGYTSPENAAFNVSYEEIIPILMTTMKQTINENENLKSQIKQLQSKLAAIEQFLNL